MYDNLQVSYASHWHGGLGKVMDTTIHLVTGVFIFEYVNRKKEEEDYYRQQSTGKHF